MAIIIGLLAIHLAIGTGCYRFNVVADGAEYLQMAENLLQSGQFTLDGINPIVGKPPGFPVLLACWLKLAGTIQGFQVLQLVLLFVAYCMVALIGKELGGPAVGLLTLGALCLLWPLDDLAAQPISEPAFLALVAAGTWASHRALERNTRLMAVIAGVAFAAATYMRPITLLFPVFLAIVVLVHRRSHWRAILTLAVVHTLLVLPWIARNYMVCGKLVPMVANWGPAFFLTSEESWQTYYFEGSGKSRESTEFLAITGGESEFNCGPAERIRQETLKRIAEAPAAYLWRGVRQSVYAWSYLPGYRSSRNPSRPEFWLVRIPMLAFYFASGYGALRTFRRRPIALLVIVAFVVFTAIMHLPVCIQARYLVPAYIALLPLALIGAYHAYSNLRSDRWNRVVQPRP